MITIKGDPTPIEMQDVNPWISVSERLPNIHDDVVIFYNKGGYRDTLKATFKGNGKGDYGSWDFDGHFCCSSGLLDEEITHWMPIPPLPEEK